MRACEQCERVNFVSSFRPLVGFHSERLWKIAWWNAETLSVCNAAPIQNQKKLDPLDPRKDENLFGTFHVTTLIPGATWFRTSGCVQRFFRTWNFENFQISKILKFQKMSKKKIIIEKFENSDIFFGPKYFQKYFADPAEWKRTRRSARPRGSF